MNEHIPRATILKAARKFFHLMQLANVFGPWSVMVEINTKFNYSVCIYPIHNNKQAHQSHPIFMSNTKPVAVRNNCDLDPNKIHIFAKSFVYIVYFVVYIYLMRLVRYIRYKSNFSRSWLPLIYKNLRIYFWRNCQDKSLSHLTNFSESFESKSDGSDIPFDYKKNWYYKSICGIAVHNEFSEFVKFYYLIVCSQKLFPHKCTIC